MTQEISPELVERMARAIRAFVRCDRDFIETDNGIYAELCAVEALLPEPVDPDLIEARMMAAQRGDDLDAGILNGDYDHSGYVAYRLQGIKRGRELAAAAVQP